MKFELNDYHRNTPDNELIEDLKRVAVLLKRDTITIDDYNQYGNFHATTLTRRFKSWFNCLEKAGLQMSRSKINISDVELFDDLGKVWIKLGKQPSYSQMSELSQYSIGVYEKRFNGWRNALRAFVNYVNEDIEYIEMVEKPINKYVSGHKTSRTINLRTRFLVLQRDKFKCCSCGASPATDSSIVLQVDHIKPWSKGGETVIDNLQTLCSRCNLGKSDLLEESENT